MHWYCKSARVSKKFKLWSVKARRWDCGVQRETAWLPLWRLVLWLPVYHNELWSWNCRRTLFIFIYSWTRDMDRPVRQAARWLQACYHACTPAMETVRIYVFIGSKEASICLMECFTNPWDLLYMSTEERLVNHSVTVDMNQSEFFNNSGASWYQCQISYCSYWDDCLGLSSSRGCLLKKILSAFPSSLLN